MSCSLRKEVRPQGISVSVVNPGYVATKIGEKHLERIRTTKHEQQWIDLYGRYIKHDEQRVKKNFNSGATTEVGMDSRLICFNI